MLNTLATATAALVVLGASSVCAQPAPDRGDGARPPALSREDAGAYLEARISALHSGLQLTPEQERLWPAFEQAYRESAKLRLGRGSEPPAADDPVARMQRRADALTRRAAAAKALADGRPDSARATSAAVSAATANATVLAVDHGITDRLDPAVTVILGRAGSVSGTPAATAITVAGHGIRDRRVVAGTAMVMGLGGSGSLSHGVSVVRATAIMAMASAGASDPAATAITATASAGASNRAVSDATVIMALASGRVLNPAVPIAATDVNSVAAMAASSAVPTAAAACRGGTPTSARDAAVRAEVFARWTNDLTARCALSCQ
jgi:hypothetical protein